MSLTAPQWGFDHTVMRGKDIHLSRPLSAYVFKLYPGEFHGQTAIEAAIRLHPLVRGRLKDIGQIRIQTQASALRIIDKTGHLTNPADRDHCLQYMTAVALLKGEVAAEDYQNAKAGDPRIDLLRALMIVQENPRFSREYLDPDKRSVANAVQVVFRVGACLLAWRWNIPGAIGGVGTR